MKITDNFNSEEFDCKDGTKYPEELIQTCLKPLCQALEEIRKITGPIHILSGYRTPKHNKKVGGAKNSHHVKGVAVDIATRNLDPKALYKAILRLILQKKIPEGGIGLYKSWVHYDLRGERARWVG